MSNNRILYPPQAGLDTTTGHGADSFFFTDSPRDPWAERCLSNVIDAIINHKKVVYPVPTRTIIGILDRSFIPSSFMEGLERNWFEVKTDISTDEVQLSDTLLAKEYENFLEWSKHHYLELSALAKFQQTPRQKQARKILVPTLLIDEFWASLPSNELERQMLIPETNLKIAFDAFARRVQYHWVLGDAVPYFPHPIREHALGFLPTIQQYQDQWSWGRYFVQLIEQENAPRDIRWLYDKVSTIRDLSQEYDATWYSLSKLPRPEQLELLASIASESNLPAKLNDYTQRIIKTVLGSAAVVSFSVPVLTVLFGLGAVAVEWWGGEVPGGIGKVIALRGQLEWPGLWDKNI